MSTAPPEAPPPSPDRPIGTPSRRRRFALALSVFGLWVACLAFLAFRAEPPDPLPGANPGDELPAPVPDDSDADPGP
ncbi:hypothetical protein [Tautonia plasticadhaerens]|uniref:Uncharacterized protein n=1 Tax=Tautonia plasticadhaerens TaxID=2527974 RepID=A0A518HBP4_9BACT|nr:hypothetical protein [Tautonia plasticadhaerens]QDV38283.1 hypothetical protein ElP_62340 [Tautonia plasticadhaerens]